MAEVLIAYLDFAEQHYRDQAGNPTDEVRHLKATSHVRELYGEAPATEFGPLALKAVRQKFVEQRWCRKTVNARVERIRRIFKWGSPRNWPRRGGILRTPRSGSRRRPRRAGGRRAAGPAERVAVVGPNVSGKTTLLALVTGRLSPWVGTVEVMTDFALLDQRVSVLEPASSIRDNFRRLNPGRTSRRAGRRWRSSCSGPTRRSRPFRR